MPNCSHFLIKLFIVSLLITSCNSSLTVNKTTSNHTKTENLGGGSSGMTQTSDNSYLVVYDVKNFRDGVRLASITITEESLKVVPIKMLDWGEEGISSDLESVCKLTGTKDEYLIAESGNWQGELGRLFHIKMDVINQTASIIETHKLPINNINNLDSVGDQYEAIASIPYNKDNSILILAERGGSVSNPRGIIRWATYNKITHELIFSDDGMKGIKINAPGDWTNKHLKRDITDLHIDEEGGIWASASEDISDRGPFYSVIYKIGQVDPYNEERPFLIFDYFSTWQAVPGFKIESLSGPCKGIDSTHSFGTEDEMYGGVWRPITIN